MFLSPGFTCCHHLATFAVLLLLSQSTSSWSLLVSLFLLNSLKVTCGTRPWMHQQCLLGTRTFYITTLSPCFMNVHIWVSPFVPTLCFMATFAFQSRLQSWITCRVSLVSFNLEHSSTCLCFLFHVHLGRVQIYPSVDCPSIWVCLVGFHWVYTFSESQVF